jgi:PilZ domain
MTSVKLLLASHTVLGVLGRDLTVRLLDISRVGCLLESSCPVAVGTLGAISVQVDGTEYADQVRIARCQAIAGAGNTHRLGAEFLSLAMPGSRSLRRYAAELAADMSSVDNAQLSPPKPMDVS